MKFRRRQFGWRMNASRPHWWWISLLLIVALGTHSLDVCAEHLGSVASNASAQVTLSGTDCSHYSGSSCTVCNPTDNNSDLCSVVSEVATVTSQTFFLDAPIASIHPAILPEIRLSLNPPCGILRSRDGPDVALPSSLLIRSSLLGRAPPISA